MAKHPKRDWSCVSRICFSDGRPITDTDYFSNRKNRLNIVIVTDPISNLDKVVSTMKRNGVSVAVYKNYSSRDAFLAAQSNNWLKLHGYPIRRKMHNRERKEHRK